LSTSAQEHAYVVAPESRNAFLALTEGAQGGADCAGGQKWQIAARCIEQVPVRHQLGVAFQ
jgi:hypothetical protein